LGAEPFALLTQYLPAPETRKVSSGLDGPEVPNRKANEMRIARPSAAVAGAVVLTLAGPPGTAQADRPIDREHFAGQDSSNFELCGLAVHSEATFEGTSSIQPAPGSDEAFLAHNNYWFTNVYTLDDDDPNTDEFVRVEGHLNFREQKATLLDPSEPDIYQFTAAEATQFRVYGSDGTLLRRQSGVTKYTVVFDTLGDGAPGGELISEDVEWHGYMDDVDFCTVLVAELT